MKKLLFSLLTALTTLGAVTTLTVAPASAVPPVRYWQEATSGLSVSGTYQPVIGNFAGSATDDIWWYAEGSATDHLWTSNGDATFAKQALPMTVPTGATPLVGDFAGDAHEDILWYGRGAIGDVLWESTTTGFRTIAVNVSGSYQTAVIDDAIGRDDVIFVGAASGSIWSFASKSGTYRSRSITPPFAGATLLPGRFDTDGCGDLFWHDPAALGAHIRWTLDCDGRVTDAIGYVMSADYEPYVGQFSPGRDAQDDILWVGLGGARSELWENERPDAWPTRPVTVPTRGTLLPVSNGYGLIHAWDASVGTHQVWFRLPGGHDFNASLSNTTIGSSYQPVVGSFVGAGADILWYRPGTSPERLFWMAG